MAETPPLERAIRNPLDPRNPLAGVYLATTLFELSEGALRFLVPLNLDARGLGPESIGLVIFAFSATSLFARGVTAGIFRHGRARHLIIGAGLASTFAYLLTPFMREIWQFTLLMSIDGFGWGVATTALLAVMMISKPTWMSSAVAMGWFVGFQGIAFALATTLAGVLADSFGIQAAMLTLATVPVMAASLISIRLPRPTLVDAPDEGAGALAADEPEARRGSRVGRSFRSANRTIRALPFAVWAATVTALYLNVMNGLLASFFPLLGLRLGLTFGEIGSLSSMRSAVSSVARFGAGWIFARIPAHRLHVPLLTISAGTLIILPSISAYAFQFPLFALNGMSRGLLRVTTGAAAMDSMKGSQVGIAAAAMTAGLDMGKMVGPLIGGFVAAAFGLDVMFRVVPLGFLLLYLVLYVATPRHRLRPGTAAAPTDPLPDPAADAVWNPASVPDPSA